MKASFSVGQGQGIYKMSGLEREGEELKVQKWEVVDYMVGAWNSNLSAEELRSIFVLYLTTYRVYLELGYLGKA